MSCQLAITKRTSSPNPILNNAFLNATLSPAAGTPSVEVMFKVIGESGAKEIAKRFSPRTIQINFDKGEKLGAEKREAIRTAIELGMLVQTHSYGDAAQWAELVEAGVRMFHTSKPEETLAWSKEAGLRVK